MAHTHKPKSSESIGGHVRFNALGLALFSAILMVATGMLTAALLHGSRTKATTAEPADSPVGQRAGTTPAGSVPAWGELITEDIDIEQPQEYVGFYLDSAEGPRWVFPGLNLEQTGALLLDCGLCTNLVEQALSAPTTESLMDGTVIHPDGPLVLSMSPKTRARLYLTLAKFPENVHMEYPFCFPKNDFDRWFPVGGSNLRLMDTVRKLLYPRGNGLCFSDYDYILQQCTNTTERMYLIKELSRQSAVLAQVRIRPDTDVEKLIGYWGRGIQVKDVRPLVESAARQPSGATLSLLHFLPKFARERLYTFPTPTSNDDPVMDCHWSTLNFFNDPPNNNFTNSAYISAFIDANYYRVGVPSLYGDVIMIMNEMGNVSHSALYLADDIVFTKNGHNFAQPWTLMRLDDLLARYTTGSSPSMLIFRDRKL